MASLGRSEVGALGYMRQTGLQRGNFKGINGRAQQSDSTRNPGHAPQKVAPKPWAGMLPTPAAAAAARSSAEEAAAAAAAQAAQAAGLGNLGSFLSAFQSSVKTEPAAAPPFAKAAAEAPSEQPPVPAGQAAAPSAALVEELRNDLLACKSRLDSVGLRLANQENLAKAMEVSVSSLREEYTKISQQTDGQSAGRLEACERVALRLEEAFKDFSTSMQREIKNTEALVAAAAAGPEAPQAAPLLCTALEAAADVQPLERLLLYPPLHLNEARDVCLFRRTLDVSTGSVLSSDFVVQRACGEPCVLVC
jgi:hypothetical protein